MKKLFKKVIRMLYLILLIILAAMGIGIAGGVPLQITHKREPNQDTVEYVMSDEEESESEQIKVIE